MLEEQRHLPLNAVDETGSIPASILKKRSCPVAAYGLTPPGFCASEFQGMGDIYLTPSTKDVLKMSAGVSIIAEYLAAQSLLALRDNKEAKEPNQI